MGENSQILFQPYLDDAEIMEKAVNN